jgi:hypothetical protein
MSVAFGLRPFARFGSKRESLSRGLMSGSAGCGHDRKAPADPNLLPCVSGRSVRAWSVHHVASHLQALEAETNLPPFDRSKPLVERLARLGMREDAIDKINQLLAAFTAFAKGDDPPESLKRSLAERADAEYSAIDQLAVLLESRRKG